MKRRFKLLIGFLVVVMAAYLAAIDGCKNADAPTLYDPSTLPQPIVDSLAPAGGALAGIDTITVYGKNFSPNISDDGVFFSSTLVNGSLMISASPTKLVLKAPAISGDSLQVRIYVIGAVNFSSTTIYKLISAISPYYTLAKNEGAYGLCVGSDQGLYASLSNSTLIPPDEGIFKITSSTSSTQYEKPTTGTTYWFSTKFGPDGSLYAVKGNKAVYKYAAGGGVSAVPWVQAPSGSFLDLDFDPNGNIWAVGNFVNIGTGSYAIYRITPSTATIYGFSFPGSTVLQAIRFYNSYVYYAGKTGAAPSVVYRAPVVLDSLGTPETYFDLANDPTGGNNIYAITFSNDGDLYAGVDSTYIKIIHPNGTSSSPYSLYVSTNVLVSPVKSFAWIGTALYATTAAGGLLKIEALKQGAPYYGIQ